MLKIEEVKKYSLDDPQRTLIHRDIILSKKFLKKLYLNWYQEFIEVSKDLPPGDIIELGSGGGFLKEVLPKVITSDILPLPNCDRQFSALGMPFNDNSVSGIFMIDVFHHIPDSKQFLKEAYRVLKPGGKIVMIEPANSVWGRFIYKNFHHEPFDPKAAWILPQSGPMSGANGALPWIVFERDRQSFEKQFPNLKIDSIKFHTPFRYLLSGGVSRKALVPGWSFSFFTYIENKINIFSQYISMFQTIQLLKF
jgi:SAM-dependent methyltransferase